MFKISRVCRQRGPCMLQYPQSSVLQVSLSGVGDVTLWDFSGQDMYFCVYHHLLTISAKNAVFVLVISLKDPASTQLRQANFWLTFLQSRIPPTEPLGQAKYIQLLLNYYVTRLILMFSKLSQSCWLQHLHFHQTSQLQFQYFN